MGGIILLATLGIVWFVINSHRPRKKRRGRPWSTPKQREQALLDALLKLDQEYEAGKLSQEVYEERRRKTKARLRSILSEKESSIR